MKKLQETFIPKNIASREEDAMKKGLIIMPSDNWFEFEQSDGINVINHDSVLHARLNGLFKPTITTEGDLLLIFTFKRNGNTFEYIGYKDDTNKSLSHHIWMKKDQIRRFADYTSAILFSNLKIKNITKEEHFKNYLKFKNYLINTFEEKYSLNLTDENLKVLESLDLPSVDIHDDLALYCSLFYIHEYEKLRGVKTILEYITPELKKCTDDILEEYSDGFLYRGIRLDDIDFEKVLKKGYVETKYVPSSWTWDEETAKVFAYPYDETGLLLKYPVKKFKNYISMDLIMENISKEQKNLLKSKDVKLKEVLEYVSESEIVVFDDHMRIDFKNIEIIKPKKGK